MVFFTNSRDLSNFHASEALLLYNQLSLRVEANPIYACYLNQEVSRYDTSHNLQNVGFIFIGKIEPTISLQGHNLGLLVSNLSKKLVSVVICAWPPPVVVQDELKHVRKLKEQVRGLGSKTRLLGCCCNIWIDFV